MKNAAVRRLRDARIRKIAADNPTLEVDMLAERFGCSTSTIVEALGGRIAKERWAKQGAAYRAATCGGPVFSIVPARRRRG